MKLLPLWLVWIGCGVKNLRPPPVAMDRPTSAVVRPAVETIDDPQIAAAFAARPQAPFPARVAVYGYDDDEVLALAEALPSLDTIASTHVIGDYLFDSKPVPDWAIREPVPLDIHELRLSAAAAHCDLLVVMLHRTEADIGVNGWVAFSPLLVPMLFTPWLHIEETSELIAHVVDVRSGYVYGSLKATEALERGPATIYALERPDLLDQQFDLLVEQITTHLGYLLGGSAIADPAPPVQIRPAEGDPGSCCRPSGSP